MRGRASSSTWQDTRCHNYGKAGHIKKGCVRPAKVEGNNCFICGRKGHNDLNKKQTHRVGAAMSWKIIMCHYVEQF